MPRSWPPNCSAVASATARGRPPFGATTGSSASRVGTAKAPIEPAIDAVGDQQRVAEAAAPQHQGERQRRHGVEQVIAQQQPAGVAAVGDQAAQRQEQQRRRHDGGLRHAHGEGVHMEHDRDQPREQHHLDAERHEPAGEAQQIDREGVWARGTGRSGWSLLQGRGNYIL